ncbi:hypothetical protein EDC01DRAFT_789346 [Geopyxis carbonaria]|nr:hypothetical protein EDC01DRAFT_789346 [Geopyxis carbonaria]
MTARPASLIKDTNESSVTLTSTAPPSLAPPATPPMKPEHPADEPPVEQLARRGPPPLALYKVIATSAAMLLALFWANACWILGKIHNQNGYAHRLHIVAADLDGGAVGAALLNAAATLNRTPGQLSWDPVPFSAGTTYEEVHAQVRAGSSIWGALVATPGASERLSAALNDSSIAYEPAGALTLLYNEARHRTVEMSVVYPHLQAGVAAVAATYQSTHGAAAAATAGPSGNWRVLLNPVAATTELIAPFAFAASVLLNTVMFVFPALSQFFLVLTLNGVFGGSGAYSTWSLRRHLVTRAAVGTLFPLFIGISWAGWVWVFASPVALTGAQFVLVALTVWLCAAINFNVIDGVCALVPMQWMPFFIISWIITQVSATINPIELASVFYRVDYVLPSHHVWGVLMTVFGKGADNHLKVNLTVCFMWLVVGAAFNTFGNVKRWRLAQMVEA